MMISPISIPRATSAPQSFPARRALPQREVHFGGTDIADMMEFGLKLFLSGVAAAGILIVSAIFGYKQVQQHRYEKNEPVCAQSIHSRTTFEKMVKEAGGRENIICNENGVTLKK